MLRRSLLRSRNLVNCQAQAPLLFRRARVHGTVSAARNAAETTNMKTPLRRKIDLSVNRGLAEARTTKHLLCMVSAFRVLSGSLWKIGMIADGAIKFDCH